MNIQGILSNARKLGLSEADISKITALSEKMNRAKAQLSEKASAKYEPRNLLGQKAEDRVFRSKGDLKQDKKDTKIRIDDSKDTVKKARKDRKDAFWKIVDATKRKDAIKAAKKQEQQALSSITRDEHHIADIDKTLADIDTEARTTLTETKTELETIATSIQTQLDTKKFLKDATKWTAKLDMNDPQQRAMKGKLDNLLVQCTHAPSLDNPFPKVPDDLKTFIEQCKATERAAKAEKVIRFTTDVAIRYYTAGNEMTRNFLRAARDSVLRGAQSQNRLLTAGNER